MAGDAVPVEVDGRTLRLTNLDKVIYPTSAAGTPVTKAEVIDYYRQVAPAILPLVARRPLTRKRWPDGTANQPFFEKNAPRGTPDWVTTVTLPTPGSPTNRESADFIVCNDPATLVWLANLAALELHVPQWRLRADNTLPKDARADLVVFDLDPGPQTSVVECAGLALRIHDLVTDLGMECYAATSGSKGMHLYLPVNPTSTERTTTFARTVATHLAQDDPAGVTASMAKPDRVGRVFVDHSQNAAAKTTLSPWSLRGTAAPNVSMPLTWDEVAAVAVGELDATFELGIALRRIAADPFADLNVAATRLPDLTGG